MAAEATAMASREGSAMMTAIAIATATVTMTTTTTTAMVTTATNNEDNKDKGGRYLVAGAQTTINMRCVEEESEHSRSKDVFLAGVVRFFCVWCFANKKESRMYDPVYDLRSRNTTENTLNITILGEGVYIPTYRCITSSSKVRQWSYFQINMGIPECCTTLCTTGM